jgi:hypothetical protein
MAPSSPFCSFNSTYTEDYLLEPNDPVFQILGQKYYQFLINSLGTDHVYQARCTNARRCT